MGAPAAHCMGYKTGGCLRLKRKIDQLQGRIQAHLCVERMDGGALELAAQSETLKAALSQRMDFCMPQAYGAALEALWQALEAVDSEAHCQRILQHGMLLMVLTIYSPYTILLSTMQVGSLLSTFGSEMAMLEDMVVAVDVLSNLELRFATMPRSGSKMPPRVELVGPKQVLFRLPGDTAWARLFLEAFGESGVLRVVPVFFTVGVNEN